jgi:hypothetical protein
VLITNLKITLQEKISQNNNTMLLLSFNKNINYKKLLVKKQAKRHKL